MRITCADGTQHAGIACVVTLPLGVMQHGDVVFEPPLPAYKTRAMERVKMARVEKLVLQYEVRRGGMCMCHVRIVSCAMLMLVFMLDVLVGCTC